MGASNLHITDYEISQKTPRTYIEDRSSSDIRTVIENNWDSITEAAQTIIVQTQTKMYYVLNFRYSSKFGACLVLGYDWDDDLLYGHRENSTWSWYKVNKTLS